MSEFAKYPIQGGGSSGVTSLNGLSGSLLLLAGTGISITPSGSNITIAATGSSGANTFLSNLTAPTSINQNLIIQAGITLNNSSNNPILDMDGGLLQSSNADWQVNFGNGQLLALSPNTSAVQVSIDWANYFLYSSYGSISIAWDGYVLLDPNNMNCISWAERVLSDQNGGGTATWLSPGSQPQFTIMQQLGTASATPVTGVLGTVVNSLQIFDASGNSLGFIPIYNSIT